MKLTLPKSKLKLTAVIVAVCGAILALPAASRAQSAYTITNDAGGSFLSGAHPTLNYGGAGTFAVASASLSDGEYDSVLMFNTGAAVSQFNTTYGVGNWTVTGVTLSLASQFGTNNAPPMGSQFNKISGGNFNVDWLSDNNWAEGSGGGSGAAASGNVVSYQYESTLLSFSYDSLGTFTYTPPGNNVYANYSLPLDANLVAGAAAGGNVSLYFTPDDNQISYLFNSQSYMTQTPNGNFNHPELTLDVSEVPEPSALSILTAAFGGLWIAWRQKRQS
jgi:hypothetical protein